MVSHSPINSKDSRHVQITGGNIRNHHFYLPLDFFPEDAIGGSNIAEQAPQLISITFQPGSVIRTDIDGTKKILRDRRGVRAFFKLAGVSEGDTIVITRDQLHEYTVSKL